MVAPMIHRYPSPRSMKYEFLETVWKELAPRIPACLRRVPDLCDDYASKGEVKLRVPFYLQTDPYSCGPVAASMVVETFHPGTNFAAFYRACRPHPLEGTTPTKLIHALRRFGIGVGIRRSLDFDALADAIESGFPVIAGVGHSLPDGDHWVVIYGINRMRKRLFVCNVGRIGHSRVEVTWREWKAWWNPRGEGMICWGKSRRR